LKRLRAKPIDQGVWVGSGGGGGTASTEDGVRGGSAGAEWAKKPSAKSAKKLKSRLMRQVLHERELNDREGAMPRIFFIGSVMLICAALALGDAALAGGQYLPGQGQMPGGAGGRPQMGGPPDESPPSNPPVDKPDVTARKAFKAAMKSLDKAKEFEAAAAAASNPDKKAKEMDKVGDAYNRALDEFTEALSSKGDMVEAWDNVGYVHLRLGAFRESLDDYNHALALKPDLMDAVEHRAEANLALDRLDEVKIAYMDLFNHSPELAAQLMTGMQKWLTDRQADPRGIRAADIDAFGKWVAERDGIAKQTASLPH
jgi:tetratricopeptide (TPR) repeat protein